MAKHWFLIIIISILPVVTFSQNEFYSKDSITSTGIKLFDGGDIINSKFCQVIRGDKVIKYSPYEVKEFGFKNGRTYKSFPIAMGDSVSQYFLELLIKGKIKLYYLKLDGGIKKYYLIKNDSINPLEIPQKKEEYINLFENIVSDCPSAMHYISLIKFKKNNLKRFINDYNICTNKPFPRFRYGLAIGIVSNHLSVSHGGDFYSSAINHNNDWSISIGTFMDMPIYPGNFSFHPEINYQQNHFSVNIDNVSYLNDIIIDYSKFTIPLLFRYSLINKSITPYFQLGPVYSRILENKCTWYKFTYGNLSTTSKKSIDINISNSPIMQNNMAGFSISSGMILKYGSKCSCFGEFDYCKLYNLSSENKLLNSNEISFKIGLIF